MIRGEATPEEVAARPDEETAREEEAAHQQGLLLGLGRGIAGPGMLASQGRET